MDINLNFKNNSAVIKTHGAELRNLKLNSGRELMWSGDPHYWGKVSPVLFPVVGSLRKGKTIINGMEYVIDKHGFARDCDFEHSRIAENDIVYKLCSNKETLKSFPFDFTFKIQYRLLTDRLKINYSVTNNDSIDMPFCIGAHPAFACPFDENDDFSDYKLVFEKAENVDCPLFDEEIQLFSSVDTVRGLRDETDFKLSYGKFINDCMYFNKIKSKSVMLTRDGRSGIKLEWQGFETLGVWTPPAVNAPFICIEPWCGSADFTDERGIFDKKQGIQTAKPGQTLKYQLIINEV